MSEARPLARTSSMRKARIELLGLELEGRILDMRAKLAEVSLAKRYASSAWATAAQDQFAVAAELVCDAHAALVKARGGK